MSDELKSCPFCGQKVTVMRNGIAWRIVGCVDVPEDDFTKRSFAIAYWNNRPIEDALRAEYDRLTARANKFEQALQAIRTHATGTELDAGGPYGMECSECAAMQEISEKALTEG